MFGSDMVEYLQAKNDDVTGLNSSEIDLTLDIEKLNESIGDFDVVINATAFTDVNLAEHARDRAFELNKDVPAKLAEITSANKQKLIHISTDYVFDGTNETPYLTTDKPNPINVYGESKLAGEEEVANCNPEALIIRTSWLYGRKGHCFPKAIIDKLNQNKELSVVDDQFGTPTSTWFLREFVYTAIREDFGGGIHHGVPKGVTSWHGFGRKISIGLKNVITPAETSIKDGVAQRPRHSQLNPHPNTKKTWQDCWDEVKQGFLENLNSIKG
jgi:dTDP-4-dehydrorhamnose reductase